MMQDKRKIVNVINPNGEISLTRYDGPTLTMERQGKARYTKPVMDEIVGKVELETLDVIELHFEDPMALGHLMGGFQMDGKTLRVAGTDALGRCLTLISRELEASEARCWHATVAKDDTYAVYEMLVSDNIDLRAKLELESRSGRRVGWALVLVGLVVAGVELWKYI